MEKTKLYISTIAGDAETLAREHGLGLEIAEFCTAYNMDERFAETKPEVKRKMLSAERFTFHAAFNELCPCAIDPKAVELTSCRLNQALELSLSLGISKLVVHSGHMPPLYFKSWFEERSVQFWRGFLQGKPDHIMICIENVFDDDPYPLLHIIEQVGDHRLRLCLDAGHANKSSAITPVEWFQILSGYISHFHIHNNYGEKDQHNNLADGNIDMKELLTQAAKLCPDATFTIETMHAQPSVRWLMENGLLV